MNESNVLRAFSEEHVMRLTGLSKSQLRYWDKTGFFAPSYSKRRGVYGRVYTFRDVVGLRTLSVLRNEHKVSLQHLRQVAESLSRLRDAVWSATTLYVLNKKVYFEEPDTGEVRGVVSGQYAIIPLVRIESDISKRAQSRIDRSHSAMAGWPPLGTPDGRSRSGDSKMARAGGSERAPPSDGGQEALRWE